MSFNHLYYPEEKDYIDKFKELYSNNILTPEGYCIYFKKEERDIIHFWRGGKGGDFNKQRASKIQWIGEILGKKDLRVVKINPKNNQEIYFICTKQRKKYVIRCRNKSNNYFFCYTAYPIKPTQLQSYLKWDNFT
jgi:hypothetical protein